MYTLKSIGVLSTAKLMGLCYFAFGLLLCPLFILGAFLQQLAVPHAPLGAIAGAAVAIILPFFYGVIGFVSGAVGAFAYNLFANWVGGVTLELNSPAATVAVVGTAPSL